MDNYLKLCSNKLIAEKIHTYLKWTQELNSNPPFSGTEIYDILDEAACRLAKK